MWCCDDCDNGQRWAGPTCWKEPESWSRKIWAGFSFVSSSQEEHLPLLSGWSSFFCIFPCHDHNDDHQSSSSNLSQQEGMSSISCLIYVIKQFQVMNSQNSFLPKYVWINFYYCYHLYIITMTMIIIKVMMMIIINHQNYDDDYH